MTTTSRATISAKPTAELAPRAGDEILRSDELQQLELFASLKKPISVEKFPGSIVLRRFRKGDVVCRQGDQGHSAFYIVRASDMQKLSALRASDGGKQTTGEPATPAPSARQIATAYILSGQTTASSGFFSKWFSRRTRGEKPVNPQYIPNDGPTDIDYVTRQAPMREGDVFGEMSCMTLAPRSATIVVDEDCYMVEFLRNIFDQMQRDVGYRQKTDELYAQRVLSTHLRRLELFQDLTDEQIEVLRQASYLEVVDPGAIICDEGEQSDSVYLIRSGVVQVVRGAHVAFRASDISDWPMFCQSLIATGTPQAEEKDDSATGKPTGGSAIADILAAARGGGKSAAPKAKSTSEPSSSAKPSTAPKGGASVADILAASRAKAKKPSETASPSAPDTESTQKKPRAVADAKDVLAAARAAMKPKADNPPAAAPVKKPGKSAASVADILAAAKKKPVETGATTPVSGEEVPASCLVAKSPGACGEPKRFVWAWFTPRVQTSIRSIAEGQSSSDDDRGLVVQALNELIRQRDFVAAADVLPVLEQPTLRAAIESFPHGTQGAKKQWSELEVRIAGGMVVRELFNAALSKVATGKGPPDILAYLSRGDCFGEMAVVLDVPRQATCIAYDHPADDSNRKPGRVELVRIEGTAFQQLLDNSPSLRASVDKLVAKRYADIVGSDLRQAGDADSSLMRSEEFRDEGLVQGQNLLLIDLDRCTRCGDCVRACVNSHDDGYSRLFLDGPRFDRFLVPSACRQCLNPSCMIGCPVGSIQRGANGQIEIRDWCIGCSLCARQCPYDSIQMHDLGVIPEHSVGWMYAPASHVGNARWQERGYRASGWLVGAAPFTWTIDLFEAIASVVSAKAWGANVGSIPEPICFRYEFQLSKDQLRRGLFAIEVISKGLTIRVWINGGVVNASAPSNPKKAKDDELHAKLDATRLRSGSNMLAIELSPPASKGADVFTPKYNQPILGVRLDLLPQAGDLAIATAGANVDLEVELVKQQAVVCDLCSSLTNQRPACVDQCPHEAAIRIDARTEFPSYS
ncbi:MAG: 4Fe-4S binding protein [Planctomycetaceae bacterium]|nr:4Fe-4S binding protein [Planctomycetales bacterium]MCB9922763.1 4Fe-4S binding protein [Planctomycetaceae bacterium]